MGACQHKHREGRQPVLSHVVAARDVRQAGVGMFGGACEERIAGGCSYGEDGGYALHTPGSAQVEAVEMDDLRVGSV